MIFRKAHTHCFAQAFVLSFITFLNLFTQPAAWADADVIQAKNGYVPGYYWHRRDDRKAKTPTQLYDNINNQIFPYTSSSSWGSTEYTYEGSWVSSGNPQTDDYVHVTSRTKSDGWLGVSYHDSTDGALKSACTEAWEGDWFCNGVPPTSTWSCPTNYIYYGYGQCVKTAPTKQPRDCNESSPTAGDPIIVATGNSFQTEVDYQSQSPFGLNFTRFYNSTGLNLDNGIGLKWTHNFNHKIVEATTTQQIVYRSNGQAFVFNFDGTSWVGDVDVPDTLIEQVDSNNVRTGWTYTTKNDVVESYNTSGQLLSVTNRAGQSQSFAYGITAAEGGDDNSETLDKVTGFFGETLLLSYDSNNRITSMTDPQGQVYSYSYDAAGNLLSASYPDDTPGDNLDNPVRTYHYENASFPSHLTGITDETGTRYVTWTYDSEGRAISSVLAGGADSTSLDYSIADQVTVTNPLGKQTTYHFTTLHGVKKVTQVEGHATASCAAANKAYTYDANGYLASKTDWQGNVTTYVHDARGLEVSRTEADGTPEARTITTQWHPDFRLPTQIIEPGKVTEFSYDAQGRLTSKATLSVQP